jgi:hypothetical protein
MTDTEIQQGDKGTRPSILQPISDPMLGSCAQHASTWRIPLIGAHRSRISARVRHTGRISSSFNQTPKDHC